MQIQKICSLLLIVLLLTGCAFPTSRSGEVYTRQQARQVQHVEVGVVESVRAVQIEGTKTPVGSMGGAAIGGIAGSSVGGGRGSAIAAVAGAIVGGLAGAAIEEGATRQDALEITVRLDSGRTVSVVQAGDVPFNAGERVRVLTGSRETRVSR